MAGVKSVTLAFGDKPHWLLVFQCFGKYCSCSLKGESLCGGFHMNGSAEVQGAIPVSVVTVLLWNCIWSFNWFPCINVWNCFVVYADGRVCISILHAPGDDPMGYESSAERWSPVQSVEKILLSVVSMLAGTNRRDSFVEDISVHYKIIFKYVLFL